MQRSRSQVFVFFPAAFRILMLLGFFFLLFFRFSVMQSLWIPVYVILISFFYSSEQHPNKNEAHTMSKDSTVE